jgi:predicted Zn-dependent peptidase
MTVTISHLANGLTVVTHHMQHLETVALGIWVKAGARDEMAEENGIAHFLEHMAFKGTKQRNAQAIAEEIENVGGEINAATGMETTTYYARVLKNDWPVALEILSDIFLNSVLDEDELEREREVILQEIAASKDQPDDLVFDLAQSASFGAHPLGRPILGPEKLVSSFSRDQMMAWRDRNYFAKRIVVCATGNVDHGKFVREVEGLFGGIASGSGPQRQPPAFASLAHTEDKPLDQTHVVLSFAAPNFRDPKVHAMQVMSNILGGGMSSRLFQEVREKRGLCYSVFAFGTAYEDTGQLGFYAATSPQNTAELMDVASNVLLSMADGVTGAEINRARAQIKSALVMNLESASSRADQIARQYLAFGEVPEMSTLIERIEAVTPEAIKSLAAEIFTSTVPSLSAVGQLSTLAPHERIAARFAKAR